VALVDLCLLVNEAISTGGLTSEVGCSITHFVLNDKLIKQGY
jgi:hypothetical protein